VSNIGVLVLDHFIDYAGKWFLKVIITFFRWVTRAGLIFVSVDLRVSCSIVLLYNVRMDSLAIIFIINSQLGLSKKT